MNSILPLCHESLTAAEIMPLLNQYQLMPQFLRSFILDQAIASIGCSDEEREQFYQQHQLQSADSRQIWQQQQGIQAEQLEFWVERQLKIQKFQQSNWSKTVGTYFLSRKAQLDQVVCSLIHVQEMETAWELYFRITEGEQAFAEIARSYSQGPEAYTGGIVGPLELGRLHPTLGERLYGAQPGTLYEPLWIGNWVVIARLEAQLPVQFDAAMRQQLLDELLENWLQEQVARVNFN